ncbi:MAG: hypothetical protein AAFX05_12010 [Planctomycetota bacterium]
MPTLRRKTSDGSRGRANTLILILGVVLGLAAATWISFGRDAALEVQRVVQDWLETQGTTKPASETGGMSAEEQAPVFSEAFRQ